MKISLEPGKYLLAVSGGLDSSVLLDVLVKSNPDSCQFVVTHLDHGMRPNSSEDARFVRDLAVKKYKLKFETERLKEAGPLSETKARQLRYQFFGRVKAEHQARAIVTAHHQDDLLETAVINLTRGTGRHGLSSLRSHPQLLRPLLGFTKRDLLAYAEDNRLAWLEDETNLDCSIQRNYIRHKVLPKFSPDQRQALLKLCLETADLNRDLNRFIDEYLLARSYRRQGSVFSRDWFAGLPHDLAREIVYVWLKKASQKFFNLSYNQKQIDYVAVKLKTLPAGKEIVILPNYKINLTKRSIRL